MENNNIYDITHNNFILFQFCKFRQQLKLKMNRSPSVEKCLFPADTTVVTSSILTSKNDKGKEFPPPPVPLSVEVSLVNGGNGERIVLHDRQQILEKEGEDGQKFLRVSARLSFLNHCVLFLFLF